MIHKVRNGQSVKDAVEDIIYRGVAELRKSAFGDDSEDAKNLPWTREQAWTVLKLLSQQAEVGIFEASQLALTFCGEHRYLTMKYF